MSRKRAVMMIAAAAVLAGRRRALRGPRRKARACGRGPTAAEFAALKQRVDQQNELIMRLTQLEGEHYEILLKLAPERPPGRPPIALPRRRRPRRRDAGARRRAAPSAGHRVDRRGRAHQARRRSAAAST